MVSRALLIVLCGWVMATPALAQTSAPAGPSVEEVVAKLIPETEKIIASTTPFEKRREHPLIQQLKPETSLAVLKRLGEKFTGDPLRDTYIRYHLMHVVMQDANSRGDYKSPYFAALIAALPAEIAYERKEDEHPEPEALYRQYVHLLNACYVTTGFPPFQKEIGPPESFQYMDAARRGECEAEYAQAQTLKGQFKIVPDPEASAYNVRTMWLKWMLHQVRGEAVYGMLMCGDAKSLDDAVGQITKRAGSDPNTAAELLMFVNAAYFDGWLGQYGKPALKSAGARLKSAVIAADRAADPAAAKDSTKRRRNLSELAFSVITDMESGNVPTRGPHPQLTRPTSAKLPALAKRNVAPETLNLSTIDDAIQRATVTLEQMRPPDTDLGPISYIAALGEDNREFTLPGHQALATWSMLATGESYQQLWMQKRISWLACVESISTYDRAMRLGVLGQLPLTKWQPWVRRDADWLIASMTDQGSFNVTWPGGPSTSYGDNANAQYAAIGFWAAEQAGYKIDDKVWKKLDQYPREAQFPANDEEAGWAIRSYKSLKPADDRNDFANRVTGPMTAAGVLSLSLSERNLQGPKMLGVGNKPSPELAHGLHWMDSHFAIGGLEGEADPYYYLWTIQNVGQASGYRTFNKIDWFRQATAYLLNQQSPDGFWKGPKGPIVSTSFALLYLARARGPLAICKVRFDPTSNVWNNRPQDLMNFTDWASRQFEVPTSWQIADLDQPVYELIESAMLYLATDKPFTLKPEQVTRLREYINAGGLFVAAPEGTATAPVLKSLRTLASQLYPNLETRKLDAKHPFYSLFQKVNEDIPLSAIDNDVRPLMVIVQKDISRDLQANSPKNRAPFNLLANLYLYAAGNNPRRPRIQSNYVVTTGKAVESTLRAARIEYDGNFDPEPSALTQLHALLANNHGIGLDVANVKPVELAHQQIAFLTATEGAKLSADQAAALRKWIDVDGTLWIDAAGGTPASVLVADDMLSALGYATKDLTPVSDTNIITGQGITHGYDNRMAAHRGESNADQVKIMAISRNGRPAVYLVRGDLSAALAGVNDWHIAGLSVSAGRGIVLNCILDLAAKLPSKP